MYMYRAAVHSLDAEFTFLEMATSIECLFWLKVCVISHMLLS